MVSHHEFAGLGEGIIIIIIIIIIIDMRIRNYLEYVQIYDTDIKNLHGEWFIMKFLF